VALTTPDESAQRVSNVSRAYRVNLNVLALVALFTGAFLVFSLQAQAVVARRTELAFLRISGVTSSELQRLLVVESLAAGIIGSLLGLALGIGRRRWRWPRSAATWAAGSLPGHAGCRSIPDGRSLFRARRLRRCRRRLGPGA
jgi:predicted lysophospholipase L1 biosynthesis ABC-type transport system permease subunit